MMNNVTVQVSRRRSDGRQRNRFVAVGVEQRPAAGKRRREPQTRHALLPHRIAALLRRRPLRAGAHIDHKGCVACVARTAHALGAVVVAHRPLPSARLAVRPPAQHGTSAALRLHHAQDHRHQSPRMSRLHLQEGNGRQRSGALLLPRLRRLDLRPSSGERHWQWHWNYVASETVERHCCSARSHHRFSSQQHREGGRMEDVPGRRTESTAECNSAIQTKKKNHSID